MPGPATSELTYVRLVLVQERSERSQAAPEGTGPDRLVLAAWFALVATAVAAGSTLADQDIALHAAPFAGRWAWRPEPGLLAAVAVGGGVVAAGPTVAARASWPVVRLAAGASAVAMVVAVNAAHGWERLTAPLTNRHEYEPFAATITSPARFVERFVESIPDLPIHVRAHPPLATLVPWALDQVGLGGAGWWAAAAILGWGVAVAAALAALRAVSGEAEARRAAPGVVLLPAVLWAGTSADAFFAGVTAVGIALVVCRPRGRMGEVAGGAVLGCAMLLSYGLALAWVVPAAVAWQRRRVDSLVAAGIGAALVLAAAALAGFWWLDGLAATRAEYWSGVAGDRPLAYLALLGNPAVLAVAAGPAVAVGLWRHRNALSLGALGAVALADASLMSAGEVERIWLPFLPWLGLASRGERGWLAAQVTVTVAVALLLQTRW